MRVEMIEMWKENGQTCMIFGWIFLGVGIGLGFWSNDNLDLSMLSFLIGFLLLGAYIISERKGGVIKS